MFKSTISKLLLGSACALLLTVTAFGYLTDTAVHAPPNYYTFIPPLAGGSYTDPVFGTTITRLTNALAAPDLAAGTGFLSYITQEYSTMTPFNSDNSRIILQTSSGYYNLYDGSGNFIKALPFDIIATSEPRWSRRDNVTLYYHSGNQLKTYNVSTGVTTVIHTFSEYSSIFAQGEMDISLDGDHLVLAGDSRWAFVYTISTDTKGPVLDMSVAPWDALYITPRNNVIVAWVNAGKTRFTGQELFDQNMNFLRQVGDADGHKHVTVDTDGSEVLIWTNAADPTPIACQNGIVKINLATAAQTCLLQLDWSLAVHISAPDNNGWAFVEAYNPVDVDPSTSAWKTYTDELLQVKLDGSEVRRLVHHRSRPLNGYEYTPRMSVSRDGSRFVFSSNMGIAVPTNYVDVYLATVPGSTTVSSPSVTTTTVPTGTTGTAYSAPLAATGGTTPYSWSMTSGSLPPGLSMSSNGMISGTPTTAGSSNFTVQVTDATAKTATQALGLTVNAPTLSAPSITTTSVPAGTSGTAYTAALTATGGTIPYAWSVSSGSLPAGLTLSASGTISGTSTSSGTSSFTVQVTDANAKTATQALSLIINAPSGGGTNGTTTTRYEQDNTAVTYAGGWYTVNLALGSGGTAVESLEAGDTASFTFNGTGVKWIGYSDAYSGIANVSVDGQLKASVDTYTAPDNPQYVEYSITGLTSGNHTLTVQVTGNRNASSGGSWVWVDAFDVISGGTPSVTTTSTTINAAAITYPSNGSVTVSVSASGSTPTGNVSLSVDGGAAVTQALSSGSTTFVLGSPNAGGHTLSATFGAQGNFGASSATGTLSVSPAATSLAISAPAVTSPSNANVTVTVSSAAGAVAGNVSLSVDGAAAVSQALSGGSTTFVLSSPATGNHTLSATFAAQGNFTTTSGSGTLTVNPTFTSTPTRWEEASTAVGYSGTWFPVSRSFFSGGTAFESLDNGAMATLTFTGTVARWIGYKDPWSGIARVFVDGRNVGTIDTYASATQTQAVIYTTPKLAPGVHTLAIRVTGQKNSASAGAWVWVDAFDVTP